MSITWGLEAEISYRQERARQDFGRRGLHRKARATVTPRIPVRRSTIPAQ